MKKIILLSLLIGAAAYPQGTNIISNPNPVAGGQFNQLWLTDLKLTLPSATVPGTLTCNWAASDGTNVLSQPVLTYSVQSVAAVTNTPAIASLLLMLQSGLNQAAGKSNIGLTYVIIRAPYGNDKVRLDVMFADGLMWNCDDCKQKMQTDASFCGFFSNLLLALAKLSGAPQP